MSSDVEQYLARRIGETPVHTAPFPHFFLENAFPDDFYTELRRHMPPTNCYVPIGETGRVTPGAYPDRYIFSEHYGDLDGLSPEARAFWRDFRAWFSGQSLFLDIVRKFAPGVRARLQDQSDKVRLHADILVVRDRTNYQIGPHTDTPSRLLSLLFYCPPDNSLEAHGTSIYVPRDPTFAGNGRAHYDFADFVNVATMPFRPNCLFGFLRTDNSFHGVERIDDKDIERDVILYNVRLQDQTAGAVT